MNELTPTEVAIGIAAALAFAAYVLFILIPAWNSYGRMWERFAASFLTLFMLGTLLGIGGAIGLALVWSYDRWA